MRWIRTTNGDKAHAVVRDGSQSTLCGINLVHAVEIVVPGEDDRCGSCDHRWRQIGRSLKKKTKRTAVSGTIYTPRFSYRDWEDGV